jgi:hypothetical protein
LYQQNRYKAMKTPAINFSHQVKTWIALAAAIMIGMALSVTTAEAKDLPMVEKKTSIIRKQNRNYANACRLLVTKRLEQPRYKATRVKYR